MQMPSDETERALQERIARLRAELRTLEGQLVTTPHPRVHFRSACGDAGRITTPAARNAAAAATSETPLPIAAG